MLANYLSLLPDLNLESATSAYENLYLGLYYIKIQPSKTETRTSQYSLTQIKNLFTIVLQLQFHSSEFHEFRSRQTLIGGARSYTSKDSY